MGVYCNPPDCSKEEWLETRAKEHDRQPTWPPAPGHSLVVLVDNGMFTAAGVAYDEREWQAFIEPRDRRPKRFFTIETWRLREVVSERDLQFMEKQIAKAKEV